LAGGAANAGSNAVTAKSETRPQLPFEISSESFEQFAETLSQAAERGQALVETGMKNWEAEVERYYQDFSTHSRDTLEALGKCKGPMDVLSVEQQWLKVRAQAYFDTSLRFARAFAESASTLPESIADAKSPADEAQPKA
jgi:hypothetical protein